MTDKTILLGTVRYALTSQLDVNSGQRHITQMRAMSADGSLEGGAIVAVPMPEFKPGQPVEVVVHHVVDLPIHLKVF